MRLEIEPFEPAENGVTNGDAKSADAADEAGGANGRKCEVQEYESRYNLKGEQVLKKVEDKKKVDDEDDNSRYAIVSNKYYSRDGALESRSLEILSPHIQLALRTVIEQYPSVSFYADMINIPGLPKCIFHYRNELAEYRDKLKDTVAKLHITLVLRLMERELGRSTKLYKALVESANAPPAIGFDDLWMPYRPGELLVTGLRERERVLELEETYKDYECPKNWIVAAKALTHDGTSFGYVRETFQINPFEGSKFVKDLLIYPLKYHEDQQTLTEKLIERGRKFASLKGSHYRAYDGISYALGHERDRNAWGALDKFPLQTVMIKSRIIVDCKMFGVMKSPNRVVLRTLKALPSQGDEIGALTRNDLLICDYRIPGFSLVNKRWCLFSVDLITPVEFNSQAFDALLLPPSQKKIVHSLVKNHLAGNSPFDDMIKGKGRGLIFVLHGVPGVGKTFTAESVADYLQRPLYVLNSGELGVDPSLVESRLTDALMLATTWNAIVLIDEADVFLEQRSVQDLQRNCLVSLFLRILEYYEGILFLTTNRITTFDLAFKSRVHLALKYKDLDPDARRTLWKNFINRTSSEVNMNTWHDSVLDRLAAVDLNGRQIKNAVRTANALAESSDERLSPDHLDLVLETLRDFEADLNEQTQDVLCSSPTRILRRQSTLLCRVNLDDEQGGG